MAGQTVKGGCLCGAVRFTATADNRVGVCHCSMCRKWTGGPFMAVEAGSSLKIEDETHLSTYRSSEWAERCFCKTCGTSLFYRLVGKDFHAVSAETLDDVSDLNLVSQIFIDEKPAYYELANKTKMQTGAEVFAEFAAAQDAQAKG